MISFFFYAFAIMTIVSALCVTFAKQPTRALFSLMITMFALSVIYLLIGAPFVAMVNLIVYAGAILVLFLFVIMLQGLGVKDLPLGDRFKRYYLFMIFFTGGAFFTTLMVLCCRFVFKNPAGIDGTAEAVGRAIFTVYHLPFELTSLLLILGIMAGVALAKKEGRTG